MSKEHLAETIQRLHEIIEPELSAEGFELVELELKGGRGGYSHLLRLTIDSLNRESYVPQPGANDGVTLDDCVRVSKFLGPVLDVQDVLGGSYEFEVSSPGVDRVLTKPTHFEKAVGQTVRIKTRVPVGGETFFIAPLVSAGADSFELKVGDGQLTVPYRHVKKANMEFQF